MRLALASVAVALLTVGGAAAKGPLPSDAYYFALDGSRLVFPTPFAVDKGCGVTVRDLATGRDVRIKPDPATAHACVTGDGGEVEQPTDREHIGLLEQPLLAIAGTRVAWVVRLDNADGDSNKVRHILETATLAHPTGQAVTQVDYRLTGKAGPGFIDGQLIDGVVGDGSLLAYDVVTYRGANVVDAQLRRVGGGVLASGPQAAIAQSADRGHIALVRWDRSAGVYPGKTIAPASEAVRSADVSGSVFGTIGKGNTLKLYALTGKLQRTIQLAIGADRLRLDGQRAVYSARNQFVHLLDLRTGADRIVAKADQAGERFGLKSLEFENGRIVYSWGANLGWNTGIIRV